MRRYGCIRQSSFDIFGIEKNCTSSPIKWTRNDHSLTLRDCIKAMPLFDLQHMSFAAPHSMGSRESIGTCMLPCRSFGMIDLSESDFDHLSQPCHGLQLGPCSSNRRIQIGLTFTNDPPIIGACHALCSFSGSRSRPFCGLGCAAVHSPCPPSGCPRKLDSVRMRRRATRANRAAVAKRRRVATMGSRIIPSRPSQRNAPVNKGNRMLHLCHRPVRT